MKQDIGAINYFETSAKAGLGVTPVFEEAAKAAFNAKADTKDGSTTGCSCVVL
jgi:hypothetical protein